MDARTRDLVLLSNGIVKATHPVDQAVVLAIIVAQGTLQAAPGIGSGLAAIEYGGPTLPARVKNAINLALASLVSAGDVTILGIEEQDNRDGFRFALSYRNNRLGTATTLPVI